MQAIIHRNKSPGFGWRLLFAVAQLGDALVRLLSLGALCTRGPLIVSRLQMQAQFRRLKRAAVPGEPPAF